MLTNRSDWVLVSSATKLVEQEFAAVNVQVDKTNILPNEDIILSYSVTRPYAVSNASLSVTNNGVPATLGSDYTINSNNLTPDGNGLYRVSFKLLQAGNYSAKVKLSRADGADSEYSVERNIVVQSPPLALPATYYFRTDTTTVNGLTANKLDTTNTSAAYQGHFNSSGESAVILCASIRVLRRNVSGIETIISDWRQAQVTAAWRTGDLWTGVFALRTATYNFPGWSNGNTTDSLVVDLGMSVSSTGTPTYIRRFTTSQLGSAAVNPSTWTVNYYVGNDCPWDCDRALVWGSTAEPTKIVIN